MKRLIAEVLISISIISLCPEAQAGITVIEASVGTAVVNMEPQGVAKRFPSTVGKLFCYTKFEGAKAGEMITHRWYYGDTLVAVVPLEIKSPAFRTYSSKKILPVWKGQWRVEAASEDGAVVKTIRFTVE